MENARLDRAPEKLSDATQRSLFAGIEELIDEILLVTDVAGKQIGYDQRIFRAWLVVCSFFSFDRSVSFLADGPP